jgi:hypothetical protein
VSVDGRSIRQRHDASPANTIVRPWPYRWTAISGCASPPGLAVTARTCAPGRGPPIIDTDASGGSDRHSLRLASPDDASRVAG